MDQQKAQSAKTKNTILKYLPKPTSSVSFQNPSIYSPSRDKRSTTERPQKSNLGIGFSGPMVSMVLADTRRKVKVNHDHPLVYEPTSPRVSCMGQVKGKNKKNKPDQRVGNKPPTRVKPVLRITSTIPESPHNDDHNKESKTDSKSKKKLGFKKIFGGMTPSSGRRRSDAGKKSLETPSLGAMKRFSSGRGKFSNIDWTKEVAAMDSGGRRYDSDEESDDEQVVVPASAPVIIRNSLGFGDNIIRVAEINVEPRNEINLWKRRTMQQPKPLQLHKI